MGCGQCKNRVDVYVNQMPDNRRRSSLISSRFSSRNSSDRPISKDNFVVRNKGNLCENYTFGKTLGTGGSSTVRMAIHRLTGQHRAIKSIKKT